MTRDRLQYLLDRYLENTATEEELQEYADWYKQAGEEDIPLFEQADTVQAQEYSKDLFAQIIQKIDAAEKGKKQVPGKHFMRYIKWAAAAMVVAGVFVLYKPVKTKQVVTVAPMKPVRHTLSPHIVTIANNAVKNRKILLKDGSVAELFPGSELRYEDPFSRSSRHVYLSGKGFFKVAKEPARPFTVYSHDIATTALGTSFTITAYPGKNQVVVALHSGKVVVKHSTQDVYLLPGQQLACNIATGMATLQPIAASKKAMTEISSNAALGARTGFSASFDQTPMPAVLDTIAKGYQVQLQYDKAALAALLFSGTIREKDSLSQVLKRMALLYNLTVKTTDKQYIIQRNH